MKILFWLTVPVFLAWIAADYALRQTRYVERFHVDIENKFSSEIGGKVKIKQLRLKLFPRPILITEGFSASIRGAQIISAPRVSVALNLFPFFGKNMHWLEVGIDGARISLNGNKTWEDVAGMRRSIKMLKHSLGVNFITISSGRLVYHHSGGFDAWSDINGYIAAGNGNPIKSELQFKFLNKNYQSDISAAKLEKNKPIAVSFKMFGNEGAEKLSVNGFLDRGFYGNVEFFYNNYEFEGYIKTDNGSVIDFNDSKIKTKNFILSGFGKAMLVGKERSFNFNVTKGSGAWQHIKLKNIRATLKSDFTKTNITNISASTKAQGKIRGKIFLKGRTIAANLGLKFPQAVNWLLEDSNIFVPLTLYNANLKAKAVIKNNNITLLEADGTIAESKVWFKIYNDKGKKTILSKWYSANAKNIARQFGLPLIFAKKGNGKILWKLIGNFDGAKTLRLKANLGKSTYFMNGLLTFSQPSFKGRVKFDNEWLQGNSDIDLGASTIDIKNDLKWLDLDVFTRNNFNGFMAGFDIQIILSASTVKFEGKKFNNVKTVARLNNNAMKVKNLTANFAQGKITADANLDFDSKWHFDTNLKIDRADGAQFTNKLFNRNLLEGNIDLKISLSASGNNRAELISNLNGHGKFSIHNGKFIGFDAGLLNKSLPQLELLSLLDIVIGYAFNQGKTGFNSLQGKIQIRNGKLKSSPLLFANDNLSGKLNFNTDLSKKKMQAVFYFKIPNKPNYPAFGWEVSGNWKNPNQNFDSLGLEKAFALDIINGNVEEIRNSKKIKNIPLPLQDLIQDALKKSRQLDNLDLELERDLAS